MFVNEALVLADTSSDRSAVTKRNIKDKKFWFQFFIMDINYPFIDMPTLRKQGIEKSLNITSNITSVVISKNLENCIYVPPSRNVLFLKLLY
jgi:hypothetical protein